MEGNGGMFCTTTQYWLYFVLFVLRLSFAEIIRVGDDRW